MSTATLAGRSAQPRAFAPAACAAPPRASSPGASSRICTRSIPPSWKQLQHAAQAFAAFWRRCVLPQARSSRAARSVSLPLRGATIASMRAQLGKAQLRFCLRAIVNALLAFGVTHMLAIPLNGQWAVPTAVAVIQMSIGGSLKAAAEYIIGTIGGALYATAGGRAGPALDRALLRVRARARDRAARLCGGDPAEPARRAGDRRAGAR